MKEIKGAIPDSLMVQGQNPLTLLHDALSIGIHHEDDVECLQRATSVRLILADLADRIDRALKENAELEAAVQEPVRKKSGR